jgi:Tfp pilus assembly protein FimV
MRYLLIITLLAASPAWAESKRIEVYPLSQHYWDTQAGDTLGTIVSTLIPANHYLQQQLMREIISLNPEVFPDGDPNRMLAERRLWLPNGIKPPTNQSVASDYIIESYRWGSIKKRN